MKFKVKMTKKAEVEKREALLIYKRNYAKARREERNSLLSYKRDYAKARYKRLAGGASSTTTKLAPIIKGSIDRLESLTIELKAIKAREAALIVELKTLKF